MKFNCLVILVILDIVVKRYSDFEYGGSAVDPAMTSHGKTEGSLTDVGAGMDEKGNRQGS